ncbi:sulfite exporter TauE/SafE family protein [Peptacetobacter sp. AB845]|uniref:sulfite exporter TauE/SafE family protein n=1 Tax=Peptacetobacter sp. AB845 TaxID=3388429 RepID=UPI0039C96D28
MVNLVRLIFAVLTIAFLVVLLKDLKHAKETGILEKEEEGFKKAGVIGFVANFIDALGIGAFAPIVAMSKFAKMKLKNKEIPALLNIGCCIPVMTEAFIFTTTIKVDPTTLVVMLAAAGLGSYVGAGIISKMDEKKVQLVMGIALFITAILMFLGLPWIDLLPGGGNEIGLSGVKLVIGAVGNFILGSLMTAGIGLYAPCMALVYFLGMSAKVSFPIMMGSCAVLMPVASIRFIKEGNYPRKATLGITIFGVIGVLIATILVKNLPMDIMKVLVVIVIIYTSYSMLAPLLKARKENAVGAKSKRLANE